MKLSKEILREINFAIREYGVMKDISNAKENVHKVKTDKQYADFYYALYAYRRAIVVACEIYQKYGVELEPREFLTKQELKHAKKKADELFETFQTYKQLAKAAA